jgi:molybdate transport system regulatory protein
MIMTQMKLRYSQWIVDADNNIIIGEGRARILEHIDQTGSMNQAARLMRMSYKAVWSKIKATEKHMNTCIVHTDRKEGSRLSKNGKDLLRKYKQLKARCISADDQIFDGIFRQPER